MSSKPSKPDKQAQLVNNLKARLENYAAKLIAKVRDEVEPQLNFEILQEYDRRFGFDAMVNRFNISFENGTYSYSASYSFDKVKKGRGGYRYSSYPLRENGEYIKDLVLYPRMDCPSNDALILAVRKYQLVNNLYGLFHEGQFSTLQEALKTDEFHHLASTDKEFASMVKFVGAIVATVLSLGTALVSQNIRNTLWSIGEFNQLHQDLTKLPTPMQAA